MLICVTHGAEEAENVLIAHLLGVEALKAGKKALMFLTTDAIHIATQGFAATIDVRGAHSIAALHQEFAANDGRTHVCPACVEVRVRLPRVRRGPHHARRRADRERRNGRCLCGVRRRWGPTSGAKYRDGGLTGCYADPSAAMAFSKVS